MVASGERIGHAACFFFYNFYLVFFDLNFVFDLLGLVLIVIFCWVLGLSEGNWRVADGNLLRCVFAMLLEKWGWKD